MRSRTAEQHKQRADPGCGRVIDNPISGERIVIRETGAQTNGQLLSFDLFLPPGSHVPARHVHPAQEEQFIIIAGQMRFRLGRRTILANPGDRCVSRQEQLTGLAISAGRSRTRAWRCVRPSVWKRRSNQLLPSVRRDTSSVPASAGFLTSRFT